jgi:hypothetical protein
MTRFESCAAPVAREGGREVSELNRTVRDTEADLKEAGRKLDGDESLGDKIAGAGDRLENAVKNAGDEVHEEADDMSRDAAYQQGRADESTKY